MKERYCTAILFALIAVLIAPGTAFPKKTGAAKSSGKRSSASVSSLPPTASSGDEGTYVIRAGDSLFEIAKTFATTPEALKSLNKLKTNRIKVGQRIKVPAEPGAAIRNSSSEIPKTPEALQQPVSVAQESPKSARPVATQNYVIRAGDSLFGIAKAFHTTPKELKAANSLKTSRIKVGQVLKVPGTQSAATEPDAMKPAASSISEPSLPAARKAEEPDSDKALASRPQSAELKTPKAARSLSYQSYVIRRGDSLYGIAKTFHITPKELKAANNLKNSRIKVGQRLKIPVEMAAAVRTGDAKNLPAPPAQSALSLNTYRPAKSEQSREDSTQPLRERLVQAGFQMLGVRYRFSGNSEKTGLDCSALVKNLFSKFDITLPRSSREQFKQGEKVDRENLEVGDLVFFSSGGKTPTHVGIYIGDNKFLHAARKARQVIISDLNKFWYQTRYLGARRVMNLWWEDPETSPESESKEN